MPLNLQERMPSQTVFSAGVSIDHLTWWFWIKAGMGFTLGAAMMAVAWALIFWTTVAGGAVLAYLANHR